MYNLARTGSMLLPANATPDYLAGSNRLTGSLLHGVWGLVASPNRGLLVFAPLSALAAGLPFLWRKLPAGRTRTILVAGIAAALYGLLIAKLTNWSGAFGWGPRLLLPVLPVVMYAASSVLQSMWPAHRRLLTAFVLAAAVWQFPAVVTNWTSAVVTHPRASIRTRHGHISMRQYGTISYNRCAGGPWHSRTKLQTIPSGFKANDSLTCGLPGSRAAPADAGRL